MEIDIVTKTTSNITWKYLNKVLLVKHLNSRERREKEKMAFVCLHQANLDPNRDRQTDFVQLYLVRIRHAASPAEQTDYYYKVFLSLFMSFPAPSSLGGQSIGQADRQTDRPC